MAIVNINVGTSPNDGTGDTLRDAFIKCNSNFGFLEGNTTATFPQVLANDNDASTSSFFIGSMYIKDDTLAGHGVIEFSNGYTQFREQSGEQTLQVGILGFELGTQLIAQEGTGYMYTQRRFIIGGTTLSEKLGVIGNAKITDRLSIGANGSTDFKLELADDDATQYLSSSTTVNSPVTASSIALNLRNVNVGNSKATFIRFQNVNSSSFNQYGYIGGIGMSGTGVYSNSIVFGFRTGSTAYNEFMRINSSGFVIGNTVLATTSTIFQIDSITKGVLLPRMTTTQVNAITPLTTGLLVYNTTLNHLCFYDGTGWKKFSFSTM